jgi:hypothetical protein
MAELQTLVNSVVKRLEWQVQVDLRDPPDIRVYVWERNIEDFCIRLANALLKHIRWESGPITDNLTAHKFLGMFHVETGFVVDIIHQMKITGEHCYTRYDLVKPTIVFTDMSQCE